MRLKIVLAVLAILVVTLACGGQGQQTDRFTFWTPTPNASPTPIVVEVIETQVILVEITPTPVPPQEVEKMCVRALVAVYLRPSPSNDNYPIMPLPNGAELADLGGRDGNWRFVQYGDAQGWVHGIYVGKCL
jgi:hypothetical protein